MLYDRTTRMPHVQTPEALFASTRTRNTRTYVPHWVSLQPNCRIRDLPSPARLLRVGEGWGALSRAEKTRGRGSREVTAPGSSRHAKIIGPSSSGGASSARTVIAFESKEEVSARPEIGIGSGTPVYRADEPPPCEGGGRGRSSCRDLANLPWPLLGKEGNLSAYRSADPSRLVHWEEPPFFPMIPSNGLSLPAYRGTAVLRFKTF